MKEKKNARIGVTSTAAGKPHIPFRQDYLAVVHPIIPTGERMRTRPLSRHEIH